MPYRQPDAHHIVFEWNSAYFFCNLCAIITNSLPAMNTILALSQTLNWIVVALLVLALVFIARLLSRRKERKNWLLMLITLVLAAALLIFVLLGLRSCGIDLS